MISARSPITKNAGPWSKKVTDMILYAVARELAKKVLAVEKQAVFSREKRSPSTHKRKKLVAG